MEPQKLIISGYYGFGNSGDEAVLWSLLTALETESQKAGVLLEPIVLSNDPDQTKAQFGVEAVPRANLRAVMEAIRDADGLISGGGSLLQDVTGPKTIPYYLGIIRLAQWYAKPTFIYAQGVGPVKRPLFRRMIGRVLQKCTYVSVRDAQSAELLAACGLDRNRIDVVPDPVIGAPRGEALRAYLEGRPLDTTSESSSSAEGFAARESRHPNAGHITPAVVSASSTPPLIGVSVRFWNEDHSDLHAIADALKRVASERRVRIRLLPFYPPGDVEASRWIAERLLEDNRLFASGSEGAGGFAGISFVEVAAAEEHPAAMMREVAACDVLVGMRLHSLIYAAAQQVALVGVAYDPKVDVFLSQLDATAAFQTEAPDAEELARQIVDQIDSGRDWLASRAVHLHHLRQKCALPAQQICQFFRI